MAKLGSSLLVPCVQELAKEPMVTVPSRDIRPDQNSLIISDDVLSSEIPVIDSQNLLCEELLDSELGKLHSACKERPFFQLVNHGVSSSLIEKAKKGTRDFFNLEMEEKKQYWQYPGELEGFGQAFLVSDDEKLEWGDIFFMTTQPVNLRKPTFIRSFLFL